MRWRITPRFGAGERPKETTIGRLGTAVLAVARPAILALYPFDAREPHHTDDEITGPDGRDRRCADDLAAGGRRRRPQLRLPLRMGARHGLHAGRADQPRTARPGDASFAWLLRAIEPTEPDLHVFYNLDGDTTSRDEELELDGYRGSRPVRRGNSAAGQLQLGCYGDLLETAELYVREGSALDEPTAARLADILDHLTTIWQEEDSGIWELPDLEHYAISKIAVWSAFDRAMRLVERGQLPRERAERWRESAKQVGRSSSASVGRSRAAATRCSRAAPASTPASCG